MAENILVALDRVAQLLKSMAAKDYNAADEQFIQDMLPHHEMAIEMVDKVLKNGKNKDVLDLAKGIKATQNDEINIMEQWLKDRGLSENDDSKDGDGMSM